MQSEEITMLGRGEITLRRPAFVESLRVVAALAALGVVAAACGTASVGDGHSASANTPSIAAFENVEMMTDPSVDEPGFGSVGTSSSIASVDRKVCAGVGLWVHPREAVHDVDGWFEVSASDLAQVVEDAVVVEDTRHGLGTGFTLPVWVRAPVPANATRLSAGATERADLLVGARWLQSALNLAAENATPVVVGVRYESDEALVAWIVSRGPDDSASFLGVHPCAGFDQFFENYAAEVGLATPWAALESLAWASTAATEATYQAWAERGGMPAWEDRPTNERQLMEGEAPPEVLKKLDRMTLTVFIGEAWSSTPGVLCTRTSLGWHECVSLQADPDGVGVLVDIWVVPNEPLEVWLAGGDGNLADGQHLISFPYSELSPELTLTLSGSFSLVQDILDARPGLVDFVELKPSD